MKDYNTSCSSGDYSKLFRKREGKVVFGRHLSNVWLLTAVLTATFLAIAFSNASLKYLKYKMDDPFINWVDIKNQNQDDKFSRFEESLADYGNAEYYDYSDYQTDYEYSYWFFEKNTNESHYLSCRFFGQLNTGIVEKILEESNVVYDAAPLSVEEIPENSLGIIITKNAINKLGYESAPSYIYLDAYSPDASQFGFDVFGEDMDRCRVPVPVLGVVDKLPGNVDIVSSSYFYEQNWNDVHTFNMNNAEYAKSLYYYVPIEIDVNEFEDFLASALSSNTEVAFNVDSQGFYPEEQFSFRNHEVRGGEDFYASYVRILVTDTVDISYEALRNTNDAVMEKYGQQDVFRLFPYQYQRCREMAGAYISVSFNNLHKITEFEEYANKYGIRIEMTQINAKNNFDAVSTMANILSWAMIAFAIVCIILFIVNLLQSYFQKVKRNIGTFKAFGIGNAELIQVYLVIMSGMILLSVVISIMIVTAVQIILPMCGIVKETGFGYLDLMSDKTVYSIVIIIIVSLFTVYKVMGNMLKKTPGDLIYDR